MPKTPKGEIVRTTIVWSKATELALRSHLRARRLKRGDLSKFIEDAVKWRLFDQTVNEVRGAFTSLPTDKLNNLIDEAVANVRKQKSRVRDTRVLDAP